MATLLDGRAVSERRLERLREAVDESGLSPRLATVLVGDDPASALYVRMKHQACERVHIGSINVTLPADSTTERVVETVRRLNADPEISGILVQLPLPGGIDEEAVITAVSPEKDVDGFHPCNAGLLVSGRPRFSPCTPAGIMTLLSEYGIDPAGRRAVVIGRSIDVGRPLAALLLNADATVTVCHRRTADLPAVAREAGILVAAVGRPRFVTADFVREGAVVIDVGTNRVDGRLVGDVDFEAVSERAIAITPVPGGVGPMTIATLMENTFEAARRQACGPAP
jgi:methylenetetrahydrofolate dehydrogenase (NADP+)/methenyltetrahydrofolate cyclohydrolase